jgi:hypothetical protein
MSQGFKFRHLFMYWALSLEKVDGVGVLLNALFIQRQHFSPSKRLKLNGAKKRNKRKCVHHYFSVVSARRALKYHHHLRSFIPTPKPTPRAKPVPRACLCCYTGEKQHPWCWPPPPPQQREPSPSPERGTKKINETLW